MIQTESSIELSDLSIGYSSKQGARMVASHLTASLQRGQLTCLLGENGVGKSTLLKTLSGFLPKLGGSIRLEGRELDDYSENELARTIGIVLTEKPDVQQMTVMELVELGRAPYTGFWGRLCENISCRLSRNISGNCPKSQPPFPGHRLSRFRQDQRPETCCHQKAGRFQ